MSIARRKRTKEYEGKQVDDILDMIKNRRTIRKYTDEQIKTEDLNKILQAGLYAPNAGGRQGTMFVAVHNKEKTERLGRMNLAGFDRSRLLGSFVSKEQPSVIDDKTIKSGFYGAPTVIAVFAPKNFLFSVPDAFVAAENMALEATSLGISSAIISRGEETFVSEDGEKLLKEWNIPETYVCRCFVILGYCDGEYPHPKPRKDGRSFIAE